MALSNEASAFLTSAATKAEEDDEVGKQNVCLKSEEEQEVQVQVKDEKDLEMVELEDERERDDENMGIKVGDEKVTQQVNGGEEKEITKGEREHIRNEEEKVEKGPSLSQSPPPILNDHEFKKMLRRMMRYIDENSSGSVLSEKDPELYSLQCSFMKRFSKRHPELSKEEKKAREQLLVLGFPFSSRFLTKAEQRIVFNKEKWDEMYQRLNDYKRKYNTLDVCKGEDPQLHQWASSQRSSLSNNQTIKSFANIERRRRLQRISFKWHVGKSCARTEKTEEQKKHVGKSCAETGKSKGQKKRKIFEASWCWEEKFEELKRLPDANNVKQKDSHELYKWWSKQRFAYKQFKRGKNSSLSYEQVLLLESIGFRCKKFQVESEIPNSLSTGTRGHQEVPLIDLTAEKNNEQGRMVDKTLESRPSKKGRTVCGDTDSAEKATPSKSFSIASRDPSSRGHSNGNFDDSVLDVITNLARLSASELRALKEYGVESKEDLALLSEDAISSILHSATSSMKVTRLHQLGRYIAKQGELTQSTTMVDVVKYLG